MELVSAYLELQRARNWNNKKVRSLGGSYAHALKRMYGDKYVDVNTNENRKAYEFRKSNDKASVFRSEVI
jgi:hypothetical protein